MYSRGKKHSQFADLAHPHKLTLSTTPTPVTKLDILHRECPVSISVKREDLTSCSLAGTKMRRLEYILYEALFRKSTVIITCGTPNSPHIQACAIAARSQGLDIHIVVEHDQQHQQQQQPHPQPSQLLDNNSFFDSITTESASRSNSNSSSSAEDKLFLARLVGAKIYYLTKRQYEQRDTVMTGLENELKKKGEVPFILKEDIGGHPSGLWAYVDMFRELLDQSGHLPYSHIVLPVGSGYTMAGLLIAKHMLNQEKVTIMGISVKDREHIALHRINGFIHEFNKQYGTNYSANGFVLLDNYIGERGFGTVYTEAMFWIQRLAKLEGILLDPIFTGKAFYGLMDQIHKKTIVSTHNVLFVHTGGILPLIQQQSQFPPATEQQPNTNVRIDIDALISEGEVVESTNTDLPDDDVNDEEQKLGAILLSSSHIV